MENANSRRMYVIMSLLGCVIIIVYFLAYFFELNYTKKENVEGLNLGNKEYVVKIGYFSIENNIIKIHGYVNDNLPEMKKFDSYYVLKNNDNNKYYKLNTIKKVINESDENLSNRGMYCQSHINFLPKGTYDLLVKYNNNGENVLLQTDINFKLE